MRRLEQSYRALDGHWNSKLSTNHAVLLQDMQSKISHSLEQLEALREQQQEVQTAARKARKVYGITESPGSEAEHDTHAGGIEQHRKVYQAYAQGFHEAELRFHSALKAGKGTEVTPEQRQALAERRQYLLKTQEQLKVLENAAGTICQFGTGAMVCFLCLKAHTGAVSTENDGCRCASR